MAPCRNKLELSLKWLKGREIPFNAIQLAGGVSCNGELRKLTQEVADKFQVPLVYSEPKYCTDNAAMIAWMGWELMNAEQDVNIRDSFIQPMKRIPLGSYVEGFVNFSLPNQIPAAVPKLKKVMTR